MFYIIYFFCPLIITPIEYHDVTVHQTYYYETSHRPVRPKQKRKAKKINVTDLSNKPYLNNITDNLPIKNATHIPINTKKNKFASTHTDMKNFAVVNSVYAEYFSSDFPARETIQVGGLPLGVNVEISCIAIQ